MDHVSASEIYRIIFHTANSSQVENWMHAAFKELIKVIVEVKSLKSFLLETGLTAAFINNSAYFSD